MKKFTLLRLDGCPYCANAFKAIESLKTARPEFQNIEVESIEYHQQPDLAQPFENQYYYVPSMFVDGKKIYEAHPGESYEECLASVQRVFEVATA